MDRDLRKKLQDLEVAKEELQTLRELQSKRIKTLEKYISNVSIYERLVAGAEVDIDRKSTEVMEQAKALEFEIKQMLKQVEV